MVRTSRCVRAIRYIYKVRGKRRIPFLIITIFLFCLLCLLLSFLSPILYNNFTSLHCFFHSPRILSLHFMFSSSFPSFYSSSTSPSLPISFPYPPSFATIPAISSPVPTASCLRLCHLYFFSPYSPFLCSLISSSTFLLISRYKHS
jgi:hypothetical protein